MINIVIWLRSRNPIDDIWWCLVIFVIWTMFMFCLCSYITEWSYVLEPSIGCTCPINLLRFSRRGPAPSQGWPGLQAVFSSALPTLALSFLCPPSLFLFHLVLYTSKGGFPCRLDSKEPVCNAGDPGLISGMARSPGERNGNPLQYSCLENSMDRGVWGASPTGLSNYTYL